MLNLLLKCLRTRASLQPPQRPAWFALALTFLAAAPHVAAEPVTASLEFSRKAVQPGQTVEGLVRLRIQPGYHLYGPDETQGLPTAVKLVVPAGVTVSAPRFPAPREAHYEALGGKLRLYEDDIAVGFTLEVAPAFSGSRVGVSALLDYQPCTDRICERPRQGVEASAGLPVVSVAAAASADSPELPGSPLRQNPLRVALDRGLLWALLAAFGWGIAASFSPCVYPMIPITVSYFGGQSKSGSTARRVALACTYVLGMVTTYTAAGVAAARMGRDLGAVMANPWMIGSLSLVLVALAGSMFGLYVLQLPRALTGRLQADDRGGFLEAFFLGLVLGFVAAPCVGPFAGSILVFVAQSADPLVGSLTLFSFGLGMGMLFIAIAVSSGTLALMPRSGKWLLALERFFGYVLIGMAIYLVSNVVAASVATWLFGAYLVAGGTYLGAFMPVPAGASGWTRMTQAAAIVMASTGVATVMSGTPWNGALREAARHEAATNGRVLAEESEGIRWFRSLEEARTEATRTGKPIFADFYADWCVPCRLMDRTTFRDSRVVKAMEAFIALKADCTQPKMPAARYKNDVLKSPVMPYLAFFGPAGNPLPADSIEGYTDASELLAALHSVAGRFQPHRQDRQ
ncbi:MAG: thioredoxin family protein [Candidatus Wallbacteria bacterium]|nr:thioredoxin family protein [Candidatus Wallbacteria bacterium]